MDTSNLPDNHRRLGLVLGGGSVRGLAHIGVLQVLDEIGFRPDMVVGVSAGSLIGGLYCAGFSANEVLQLARNTRWRQLGELTRPGLGIFSFSRLEQTLDDLTGGANVEDLSIPFVTVATDILSGQMVVFRSGPLARAVRASCSVPGLIAPVEDEKRLLVDGGVLNDLPVGVARDFGAGRVLAVNLLPPPSFPSSRPENIFEMWSLSFYTLARLARLSEARHADLCIVPDIADTNFVDFRQLERLVQKGREAALDCLEEIQALINWQNGR